MPDDKYAPSDSPGARYATRRGLRVRSLGDDLLVLHPLSWDVHLLNPAAGVVLDACLEVPQPVDSAAAVLREVLSDDLRPKATLYARLVIEELANLGLIDPVTT